MYILSEMSAKYIWWKGCDGAYWHYRLGVVPPGEPVPPLPTRALAS